MWYKFSHRITPDSVSGLATHSTTKKASSSSHAISNELPSLWRNSQSKTTSSPTQPKTGPRMSLTRWSFWQNYQHIFSKTYESLTRYYGRYSCRRRGERAKKLLSPPPAEEPESDYRQEFRKSSWAGCIKRVYEIDPLECPKCKAQMRIIAFIQDAHSIKDIMKAQGIPDFQAPPPIPKFIDTSEAIDELPLYDSFEPAPDDF